VARAALLGRLTWQVGTVVSARRESLSARTIAFDLPQWPGHLPGQHVDVRLTAPDGYSTERSYSIASAWDPSRPVVELTVESVEDGEVSPYLVDVLAVGGQLELRGPVGGWFVWRASDPGPVLLVAGGSGVVPLMAMSRARALAADATPFRLVYSVRTAAARMYVEELAALAAADPAFRLDHVYTRHAPDGWVGRVGRIRPEQLLDPTGGAPPGAVFVCGPTGFVEAVAGMLGDAGVAPGIIKTERFGPTGG
jgi:ferredoxin-NADP reductase